MLARKVLVGAALASCTALIASIPVACGGGGGGIGLGIATLGVSAILAGASWRATRSLAA